MPHADAARIAALPPVSIMFAALLGYNPIKTLLGHALTHLPASHAAYLTGHRFFPSLISAPFEHGLAIAFGFSIAACLIAAVASLLRGGKYVHGMDPELSAVEASAEAEAGSVEDGTVGRPVGTARSGTGRGWAPASCRPPGPASRGAPHPWPRAAGRLAAGPL